MRSNTRARKPVVSNSSWVTFIVLAGVVVALGLWDSGWKPTNAFLAGFMVMIGPGTVFALYRLWEARERVRVTYEQAKMMFRAARMEKEERLRSKK